jgi:hypothetical protein
MPCERVEQPLSRSTLEDTGAPAPMEIMMIGPPEDICLLTCSPQSPGTHGGPGAALNRRDTWQPRSFPQPGGESHCLNLKLVRGGTRTSGY